MTVQIHQDESFISDARNAATKVVSAAQNGTIIQVQWNTLFGGVLRLGVESFTGNNEGLAKADIEAALNVLTALNTWLDSDSRRSALMKILNM